MSPCMRSITIAAILSAVLAFGAVAVSGQEPPSPPTDQSYSGSDLFSRIARPVTTRRRTATAHWRRT
jgi:hypothetical protein